MSQMNVLLVDDQEEEVRVIMETFRLHPLISVDYKKNYSLLGSTEAEFVKAAESYELLILDILMDKDQDPFIKFVGAIAGLKPFIAYTQLPEDDDLDLASGSVPIRQWVASNGGLGVVTKSYARIGPSIDIQYEIVERIMMFYWCTR